MYFFMDLLIIIRSKLSLMHHQRGGFCQFAVRQEPFQFSDRQGNLHIFQKMYYTLITSTDCHNRIEFNEMFPKIIKAEK